MTRPSRNPAPNSFRAGKEALPGPHRCVAGPVPRSAFPRRGTLRWPVSRRLEARQRSACAGFGARAASVAALVAFAPQGRSGQSRTTLPRGQDNSKNALRHSVIAFCTAHVLNSSQAPIASLTGKLTRHERRPNRGRYHAKTRCGACRSRNFTLASLPDSRFCRRNFDADLIGSVIRCVCPLVCLLRKRAQATVTSRCGSAHRAKLCRSASPCIAPLP